MAATRVAATAPAQAPEGAAAEREGGRVVARQGCNVRSDPKATAAVVRTTPPVTAAATDAASASETVALRRRSPSSHWCLAVSR